MNTMRISEDRAPTERVKLLYTAKVHTTGGRDGGSSRSSDGRLDIRFSLPEGPDDGTNPEQLFAAAWSGCFLSTLKQVAAEMGVSLPVSPVVGAEVELWEGDGGSFLRLRLNVSLPRMDREIAQSLLQSTHLTCPYRDTARGGINLEMNLV